MNSKDVFINSLGKFLPGKPIDNSEMEDYLGLINGKKSKARALVLRQNRIKTRYYALDKEGNYKFTNAELAAKACEDALSNSFLNKNDIQYLATATTQGDLLVPGMGSAVHAELGLPPLEIANFQSVCASSVMALKAAWLQVKAEEHRNAMVCASEFSSRWFRPGFYEETFNSREIETPPIETEFLRWTLSDGSGAALLENKPNEHGISLKIDWIKQHSYADRFDNCMFAGSESNDPEDFVPWSHYPDLTESIKQGAIVLQQDFELLYRLFPVWLSFYIELINQGLICLNSLDHFVGHYSAHSLRNEMIKLMEQADVMIPEEKWFTNLYEKGNTGSASIFIILEELFYKKDLEPGQKILCFVPESGRCIVSFVHLTVV